jgi:hypothetical protein
VSAGVRRSNEALLGRREGCAIAYLHAFQGGLGDVSSTAIDALAVDKRVARCSRHRVWIMRIDEIKVVNVGCVDDVGVPNKRIADVYSLDKPAAAMETGKERFSKS